MDLDVLLSETADVSDPTSGVVAAGAAQLDLALTARRRRTAALRRRSARRAAFATITAAAAAAAIIVPIVSVGGRQPTASAGAATALRAAAVAAGAQPGGWPDAAFWHVSSVYIRPGIATTQRDIWQGRTVDGEIRDPSLGPGLHQLNPGVGQGAVFPVGPTSFTWAQLYALPTDPTQLEAALRSAAQGSGESTDTTVYAGIGNLLIESPASPQLRQALYEVAAELPGVQLVGSVRDRMGRLGTAVERDGVTYVFDTTNGMLLQDSEGGYTGTYLEQGPASSEPTS